MRRWRLLAALAGLMAGVPTATAQTAPRDDYFALRKNFEIFARLYEELSMHYVDPLDPERVLRRGMTAMLADLDPYTNFLDEYVRTQSELLRATYGSVGVSLEMRGGRLVVVPPLEGTGTEGYAQGLRPGDTVESIAGRPAAAMTVQEAGTLLRGEPGTTVEMEVARPGVAETLRFVLTRADVDVQPVTFSGFVGADTTGGVGYVRLQIFTEGAGQDVRAALETLQASQKLTGLVLDLRGNPGGIVQEALEIVGLFVPAGTPVVTLRGREAAVLETFQTPRPPAAPDLPLVVLMDALSASASEIVAGALQDLDRAVVVGETSFGKGLVQTFQPLPYNTLLKITSGKYVLPSGRLVQRLDYAHDGTETAVPDSLRRPFATRAGRRVRDGGGIEPDVVAAPPDGGALGAALEREARYFAFANAYAARHATLPADFEVDGDLLAQFRDFLAREGFAYETDAERALDGVVAALEKDGYGDARARADALREAIGREKEGDFRRHADAIRRGLRREILARRLAPHALTRALLDADPVLARALALVQDRAAYARLLAP